MVGWLVLGIIIGLAIVAFAVGVPYLITHKGMRSPYDRSNRSEARAYFHGKRRRQRQEDAAPPQAGQVSSRQGSSPGSSHGGGPADSRP